MKTQKALTADLENMHSELESMTRSKSLVPVPPGAGPPRAQREGPGHALYCTRRSRRPS